MSDPLEQLEKELQALRPVRPSPTLRQCIAERLTDEGSTIVISRWRRLSIYFGTAAAFIAACLAFTVWMWPTGFVSEPEVTGTSFDHLTDLHAHIPVPTMTACQLTASQSPDALIALLDKQADRILIAREPIVRSYWFTLSKNHTTSQ